VVTGTFSVAIAVFQDVYEDVKVGCAKCSDLGGCHPCGHGDLHD